MFSHALDLLDCNACTHHEHTIRSSPTSSCWRTAAEYFRWRTAGMIRKSSGSSRACARSCPSGAFTSRIRSPAPCEGGASASPATWPFPGSWTPAQPQGRPAAQVTRWTRTKRKAAVGSATASRPATKNCTAWASPTRSNAGAMRTEGTDRTNQNWLAGSTASDSMAYSAERACSRVKATPRKWLYAGSLQPYAAPTQACSIASS